MLNKNDITELTITDITTDGAGIGKADGIAVFVRGALLGEKVKAKIIKKSKKYLVARMEEIIEASSNRVVPPCKVFERCGGCTLQHLSYEAQLAFKRDHVQNCFKRIGGIDIEPNEVIPSDAVFEYRNKAAFPVSPDGIGCYAMRTHNVIDTENCMLQSISANECIAAVKEWMKAYNISPYNEVTGRGVLRHVVVRTVSSGDVMAAVVSNKKPLKHADELVDIIKNRVKNVKSIAVNYNTKNTNAILGSETCTLWGSDTLEETILGNKFKISLPAFLQINHGQTEKLYNEAYRLAQLDSDCVAADLYCGAGTISLGAAKRAKMVYGIEIVPEAIQNAKENAKLNGINNAEFYCGDCADIFPRILEQTGKLDVIIVDPPRKGLDPSVINTIAASGAKRVVYVSCDPSTLARDAKLFSELGYLVKEATPVDMFPETTHVETVCLLQRAVE